jgi:type I restriction enzyme S subunit
MQEEKQLVPQLRFSEFEGEWQKKKLSKNIEFIAGYAFNSAQMKSFDSKYQLIKMSNVYKNKLDLDRNPSYWDEIDNKTLKFLLKKKDILLTLTGTVGKKDYGYSIVIPEHNRFLLNQRLVCLRAKNNISDSDFINNLIKTSKFYYFFFAESKGGTGNQTNVGIDDLRKINLNFPRLEEQQKIANFLTSIDNRIQTLEKKKTLLEQYKKGVMQKIFKQELRFKDDTSTTPSASDGKAFPEWEEKKLGLCLKHKSNRNKKLEIVRTLSVSNSKGFILQSEQFGNHRVASKDVSNYKIVKKNDIAYNPSRINVGSIATLKDFEIGIVSPMYVVFSLKNTLNLTFFENLITTHLFKHLVIVGCSGSVRDSLNFEDLESFKLKLPCIKEQTKIANFLSAIDKNIELVTKKIEHTKTYKKGLLQQMFV